LISNIQKQIGCDGLNAGRVAELDGLRGLAAVAVVVHHLGDGGRLLPWGWAAVDLFFVLSGYLITGIILKYGRRPGFLRAFYLRRGLRIWPIYYLALAAALLVTRPEPGAPWFYLTYLQNVPRYLGGAMPVWHEMVHCWTLALEEQFYLIWPAIMLLLTRTRHVALMALSVAIGSFVARLAGCEINLLVARCDGFALGALLACLHATGRRRLAASAGIASAIGGILALIYVAAGGGMPMADYRPSNVSASVLLSFALLVAVAGKLGDRSLAWLRWRPVVYLGTISYGLYLYHYPIQLRCYSLTMRLGIHGTSAEPYFVALLSLAAAALSWHVIERPLNGLKRYFPYAASPQWTVPLSAQPTLGIDDTPWRSTHIDHPTAPTSGTEDTPCG
jgi:peptidoglycan/LPS O-acetylase OafA/YrhL